MLGVAGSVTFIQRKQKIYRTWVSLKKLYGTNYFSEFQLRKFDIYRNSQWKTLSPSSTIQLPVKCVFVPVITIYHSIECEQINWLAFFYALQFAFNWIHKKINITGDAERKLIFNFCLFFLLFIKDFCIHKMGTFISCILLMYKKVSYFLSFAQNIQHVNSNV